MIVPTWPLFVEEALDMSPLMLGMSVRFKHTFNGLPTLPPIQGKGMLTGTRGKFKRAFDDKRMQPPCPGMCLRLPIQAKF
jgi:hypothetical protein